MANVDPKQNAEKYLGLASLGIGVGNSKNGKVLCLSSPLKNDLNIFLGSDVPHLSRSDVIDKSQSIA
jgi:hypothetical protein